MKNILKDFKRQFTQITVSLFLFVLAVCIENFGNDIVALIIYILSLATAGYRVFIDALHGIVRRDLLDEKFLMSISSVGAMIIGEWSEGCAVMLFFLIGETFEQISIRRSRNSIRSLMQICPDEASVMVDGKEVRLDAEDVSVGSVIVIRAGERVPIDSVVLNGSADIDTSALTGESVPRSVTVGDTVNSGVVVLNGHLICQTEREASESAAARVLALVEEATESKSKEENFITKFSHFYTPTVVILALILAVFPPIFKLTTLSVSVYRALIFLVISCPCALVISVPMAFFGGIGGAASRGILFKGGNIFSRVASADTIAFDKTGTLTSGIFIVNGAQPIGVDISTLYYLAASSEYTSNHPLAECIKGLSENKIMPSSSREIAGEGVIAELPEGTVAVGNGALMRRVGVPELTASKGEVYVAKDGRLIGIFKISDEIKPEATTAIRELSSIGVRNSALLSGDRRENVNRVAGAVGITDAHAELTPEQKYRMLEALIEKSQRGVFYVGDGINDAPALARADVGIAMGTMGQDSAIEAADVVIMGDSLLRIPEAVKIARKTVRIAKENIAFALTVKLLVMVLGALGFANMWLAVFADVGVAILAILNSMRALKVGKC